MTPKVVPDGAADPAIRAERKCRPERVRMRGGWTRGGRPRLWGEDRVSLYQISTRASRRRRIGAWLRTRWRRRVGSGRHHQTGDVSPRHAYTPKVVQHAFVPPGEPSSADLVDVNVNALVKGAAIHADGPTRAESTNGTTKVPQQRPPRRITSVYPNAYRAR
jgi:hypothetical protein